jgi:hypothetical protein
MNQQAAGSLLTAFFCGIVALTFMAKFPRLHSLMFPGQSSETKNINLCLL